MYVPATLAQPADALAPVEYRHDRSARLGRRLAPR